MKNLALREKALRSNYNPILTHMLKVESHFQGETFHAAIQRPWYGKILLITHNGWYLETEDKQILLLHDAAYGEVPIGAALPALDGLPYSRPLEGSTICYENGILSLLPDIQIVFFPSCSCGRPIDRQQCISTEWTEYLKNTLIRCGKGYLRFSVCGNGSFDGSAFQQAVCLKVRELMDKLRNSNAEELDAAIKMVLGLGSGLTPSCDDWLLGFMYAAQRIGKSHIQEPVCEFVQKNASYYTNSISAAYLHAVSRGEYFDVLDHCLFRNETDDVDLLLSIGSSSGSDMLSGMLAAITYKGEL